MSQGIATVGCGHFCPQSKHGGGGPILSGSSTVFCEGKAVAVVGSTMFCARGVDSAIGGSSSIYVNGKPAVRIGDPTLHGGKVLGGSGSIFSG